MEFLKEVFSLYGERKEWFIQLILEHIGLSMTAICLAGIIGLLLGISLGVIWAIVKEITDTTVKEIDLLTNELGLTDLGVVYHISDNNKRFRIVNVEDDSNEDEPNNDIRRV